jgi:hypothetical protein
MIRMTDCEEDVSYEGIVHGANTVEHMKEPLVEEHDMGWNERDRVPVQRDMATLETVKLGGEAKGEGEGDDEGD